MWKNVAKQAISRTQRKSLSSISFSRAYSFHGFSQEPNFSEKSKLYPVNALNSHLGFCRKGENLMREEYMGGKPSFGILRSDDRSNVRSVPLSNGYLCSGFCPRGYASVAEAVSSPTDVEEDVSFVDEVQELVQEMRKEERRENERKRWQRIAPGMGSRKYQMLKRRQVKIETEAWERAANEYRELLMDMCEHKLAPNLPYMKSLFLGWFEPLRDAILKEQELMRLGKSRAAYAPYFDQLPADMMSVITMHKLMALMMTFGEHGSARVVPAAITIGDAVEQEVGDR